MVNTGKPSRGCDVCRRRKIKCDEVEPTCSYCRKRNLACSGSKPQFDVAWRDQNQVAKKSVQRRHNATQQQRDIEDSDSSSSVVPKILQQDIASYAVNFFFTFYICLPKEQDYHRNVLDCLYPIWKQSSITSPLRPIVTAVASALLDAWSQVKPDQPGSLSRSQYAQGVAALRECIERNEKMTNEIIMTALMLDMYNNVLSFLTGQRNKTPHMTGTTALIESRRRQPHGDEMSQKLILGTRSQVAGRAVADSEPIPPVVSTWSQDPTALSTTPGFRLDELNLELVNIRSAAAQLLQATRDLAFRTLQRARALDHQYTKWMEDLPEDWLPTRVSGANSIPASVRATGCYQDFCDIYRSIFVANTLVSFYSARLKTQLVITTCLEHLPPEPGGTSLVSASSIAQNMADDVCASIPFHLGDRTNAGRLDDKSVKFPSVDNRPLPEGHYAHSGAFGAFFLIVFLAELLPPNVVLRPGQKPWIGGQIHRIRQICSISPS